MPKDQLSLRLLLVTGETHTFSLDSNINIQETKRHIFNNWPLEWEDKTVEHPSSLKLLYRGKFLNDTVRLSDLDVGKSSGTVVMHLILQESDKTIPGKKRIGTSSSNSSSKSEPAANNVTNNSSLTCCAIL